MPDEYQPSEAAIEAALSTSTTFEMRDGVGKEQYRNRVIKLLKAAGPVIEREAIAGPPTQEMSAIEAGENADWGDLSDDARYQFTGATLKTILHEVAGATSRVFMERDSGLVMPSKEVSDAVREYAKLSPEHWGEGGKSAEGILGAGALTLGAEGVKQVRRLIDQEGTPQDYEQMVHILDAAIAAGESQ